MITKLVTHYEYFARNEARYEARNAPVLLLVRRSRGRLCFTFHCRFWWEKSAAEWINTECGRFERKTTRLREQAHTTSSDEIQLAERSREPRNPLEVGRGGLGSGWEGPQHQVCKHSSGHQNPFFSFFFSLTSASRLSFYVNKDLFSPNVLLNACRVSWISLESSSEG